jgi:hypothetical protein
VIDKPKTSTGKKIDANMEKARIALFAEETPKLKVSSYCGVCGRVVVG